MHRPWKTQKKSAFRLVETTRPTPPLGIRRGYRLVVVFRPELLFINQRVNETPPTAVATLQPVFTGSLRPLPGMQDTHGRVNMIDRHGKLQLEINWVQSLGSITVVGHKVLSLPIGLDPGVDNAVLMTKDKRLVATAILEPF